ncbi:MAG TPA: DUF4097 family beta strand repeat-containing protein [Kofleriaceae bacterium]|nr:DUF4097 family beta strand repeat-containing protein [Kofleriaceae bacterium]
MKQLLALLALLLAPRAAAAQEHTGSFERSVVEVEPSAGPIAAVTIDNRYGDVRVEGHDGDTVVIHAFKRAGDDDALERLKVSLVSTPSGGLRIGTRLAEGREGARIAAGSIRIDLVIQAPRDAAVSARAFKGNVQLFGMENGARLDTEEGDIEVRHASGKIETDAARGKQQFSEIVGDLQARGQFGAMELDTVRGLRLEAMLHEGSVIGRRITSRNVTVWISRGNIRIDGTATLGGSWRLMTYQGDVEVRLGRALPMTVRARARSGQVHLPPQLRAAPRDDDGWTLASNQQRAARAEAMLELASSIGNIAVSF